MDKNQVLDDLYTAVLNGLLAKIKSGEATAADYAVARQFLKDNNISSTPEASPPLVSLRNLPFPDEYEREEARS